MAQFWQIVLLVLIFCAVVLAVEETVRLVLSSGDQSKRVNRRLTMLASGMQHAEVYSTLVRKPSLPFDSDPLFVQFYERFVLYCRQAGVQMSPLRLLTFVVGIALVIWLFTLFSIRASDFLGVALNASVTFVASFVVVGLAAWVWLARGRAKRLRALEDQLPSALDIINRALRAGHPVVSAVQLASDEMGDPIGSEFGLIVDETTYGFEFKEALANFARRSGSADAKFFAVSVGVQSETGGNLAEVLEGLSAVMRGRATLGKRVKALSSEGRISALILTVLPVFLVGTMLLVSPGFYTSKFADPIFWPSVAAILALYFVGWLLIYRIINFRY